MSAHASPQIPSDRRPADRPRARTRASRAGWTHAMADDGAAFLCGAGGAPRAGDAGRADPSMDGRPAMGRGAGIRTAQGLARRAGHNSTDGADGAISANRPGRIEAELGGPQWAAEAQSIGPKGTTPCPTAPDAAAKRTPPDTVVWLRIPQTRPAKAVKQGKGNPMPDGRRQPAGKPRRHQRDSHAWKVPTQHGTCVNGPSQALPTPSRGR